MTVASTPELESDRQALIALIGDEAVFHGDFTLSSGKKATYYVDMRKLTSTTARRRDRQARARCGARPRRRCGRGLTLGADPIANAVLHASVPPARRWMPSSCARSRRITAAVVRSRVPRSRASAS
jgi:orotate phosphoribosyltransferase